MPGTPSETASAVVNAERTRLLVVQRSLGGTTTLYDVTDPLAPSLLSTVTAADYGINAKLDQDTWAGIVQIITEGIRRKRPADAICEAVAQVGRMLETHFPIRPDDQDELRNVIVADDD